MNHDVNGDRNPLCPICHEAIPAPERSAIIGGGRVHLACWWAPFEPPGGEPDARRTRRKAVSLDAAVAALGRARGTMHCDQCWADAAGFPAPEDKLKLLRMTRVFNSTTQPMVLVGDCGVCGKHRVVVIGYSTAPRVDDREG